MVINKNETNLLLQELFGKVDNQSSETILTKVKELKLSLESEQKVNSSLREHINNLKKLSQSTEFISDTKNKKLTAKNNQLEYYIEIQKELKKENTKLIYELHKKTDELEKLNSQLEITNNELDQFSYTASHDLKSPLRAIFYLSQWILEDESNSLSQASLKNLQLILSRVKRLEGHLTSLFEYSKIGRGTQSTELCDLNDLINDIYEIVEKPKPCSIDFTALPTISAPKVVIKSVFMNLITNAIKHNNKGHCKISISCTDSVTFYKFYVKDNGPGIEPKNQKIIFDFFKTLKARDKVEGSGLGLAIVKKYVSGYGGTVGIQSSEIDVGTCFYFTWPKTSPEQG